MKKALSTLALGTSLLILAAPSVYAQSATTLGGGGATRANGGAAESGTAGSAAGTAGTGTMSPGAGGTGQLGGPAESAAKGNDPTGTNGATNNRY